MANAKKRCRSCKKYDLVESGIKVPLGWFCSMACVVEHGKKGATVSLEKIKRDIHTKLKAELKTASQWRKEAQKEFNAYVRWRDRDLPCVSCDSPPNSSTNYWDAGHFRSRAAASQIAYNLWNVNKQCVRCNRYLSANLLEYRIRLVERIGLDRVVILEHNNDIVRHDIKYLARVKQIFKAKLRIKLKLSDN